jgi:hypothetical protein
MHVSKIVKQITSIDGGALVTFSNTWDTKNASGPEYVEFINNKHIHNFAVGQVYSMQFERDTTLED